MIQWWCLMEGDRIQVQHRAFITSSHLDNHVVIIRFIYPLLLVFILCSKRQIHFIANTSIGVHLY